MVQKMVLHDLSSSTTRTTTPTTSSFQFCFMTPHPPQTATPRQPPPPFGLGLINQAPTKMVDFCHFLIFLPFEPCQDLR